MRRYLLLPILLLTGIAGWAQPTLFIGNDTSICSGSLTLNAVTTNFAGTSSYTNSQIPFAPRPVGGTPIGMGDDNWSGVVNIGFTFCYYSNTYTQCLVGSNGGVCFNLANANGFFNWSIGAAIPSAADPTNTIMVPWEDLYPPAGGTIQYQTVGTAPNREFQVFWTNVSFYSCTGTHFTGQLILHETTNEIETQITSKPLCPGWNSGRAIHGIQNNAGTLASVYPGRNSPTQWTATNDGALWTPSGAATPTITWYANNMGNVIGTGPSITVTPPSTTTYYASATACGVTLLDTIVVSVSPSFSTNFTNVTNPTCFGFNNGSATINANTGPPLTYSWNSVPVQNTQTASNLGAGQYIVSVTSGNCTVLDTVVLTQPAQVIVTAVPASQTICAGTSITENATGANTYAWYTTPGYAFVANGISINPTPLTSTTYAVIGTGPNGCMDTGFATITVNPIPASTFSVSPASLCIGQPATITYTGGASAGATYTWNFAGGTPATASGQGPQAVTWNASGTYNIDLTVTENGCTSPITTNTVTVNPVPVSTFSISPAVICAGSSYTYTYTGGSGASATYNWTFTGGTPGVANGVGPESVQYPNPGDFNASLTVTDNGCTSAATVQTVHVTQMPTSSFTLPAQICLGSTATATYTGNASAATGIYTWSFGTGGTGNPGSGAGPQTISYTNPAVTQVTLIVSDSGCTSTLTSNPIQIIQTPVDSFSWLPNIGCMNVPINFTYGGVNQASYVYNWTFAGGAPSASGQANPVISFPGQGWHVVTLSVADAICVSPVQTDSIFIDSLPVPMAVVTVPTGCDSIPNELFMNSSTNTVTCDWRFGDGTTATTGMQGSQSHDYHTNGTYTVELICTSVNGCRDSLTLTPAINIIPTPVAGFSASPDINMLTQLHDATYQFTNTSTNAVTYQWFFGDGDSSSAYDPSHQYIDTGHYQVTLIAVNQYGCTNQVSAGPYIVIPNNNYFIPNAFTPNHDGENDEFKIYGTNFTGIYYSIFDRWGNKVFESRDQNEGWDGTFHGKVVQGGVFMYYAELTFIDGEKIHLKGDVTVLK